MFGRWLQFGREKDPSAGKMATREAATREQPVARLRFVAAEPGTASATFAARDHERDVAVEPSYLGPERRERNAGPPPGQSDRRERKPSIIGPARTHPVTPAEHVATVGPVSQPATGLQSYTGPDRRARDAGPSPGQPERRNRVIVRVAANPRADRADRQPYAGPNRRARNAGPPPGQSDRRMPDLQTPAPNDIKVPKQGRPPSTQPEVAQQMPPVAQPARQPMPKPVPPPTLAPERRAEPEAAAATAFDHPPASVGQMPPEPERRVRATNRSVVQPEPRAAAPSGFGRRSRE